jgi:hypothetical protein
MDDCLKYWAVEDESWVLQHGLKTKQENRAWLHPSAKRPRVVRPMMTNKKCMLIWVFTGDGKIFIDYCKPGQTLNSESYVEFIRQTGENWRKLRSSSTKLQQLWWQHDNARCHTSRSTTEFLTRRKVRIVKQAAYSPDLNMCDRWVFRNLKKHLRTMDFQSAEEIVSASLSCAALVPRSRQKSLHKRTRGTEKTL